MDGKHFDILARRLSSRRTVLGNLIGGGLAIVAALAAPDPSAAHSFLGRCRKIKNPARRRACIKRAKAHNAAHRKQTPPPPPPPPQRQPNAECTVVGNVQAGFPADLRAVQTFTEPNGGRLGAVELYFANQSGVTGTYLVQINTVDQATGVPQNNTIASAQKSSTEVSRNLDLVLFGFGTPPTLVAGQQYAILLSRPGGTGGTLIELVRPGTCPGGEHFTSFGPTGAFQRPATTEDMYYRTFVSP